MTMTREMPKSAAKRSLSGLAGGAAARDIKLQETGAVGDSDEELDASSGRKPEIPDQADPIVPYSDVVNTPGHTVTEGEITLHTRMGHRLFYGRRREGSVQPIIGLVRFVSNTNGICEAARLDDPYADWRLLQIEESLVSAEAATREYLATVRELLDDGDARRVRVKSLGSVKPATFRLSFQYAYGFRGADLLALFDQLAESALSAKHVGRLFSDDWNRTVNQSARMVRHLFALSASFRYSGASRDDIAANNARGREAVAKYGELPADVLQGERRPLLAPSPDRRKGTKASKTGAE